MPRCGPAEAAEGRPLTWLIDPAVADVVRRLAKGNPARTLEAPTDGGNPTESPSPSDSPSSSGSASAADDAPSSTAKAAHHWLRDVRPLLSADTSQLLGLPYGDLAVDSAARYDATLLPQAFRRTGHTLEPWGSPLDPVVAPPDGRISSESLPDIPRDADVLLSDTGVDGTDSVVNRVGVHRVILASTARA